MPRNADDAIEWGRREVTNRSRDWTRLCLIFVRSCFGVDAYYPDAGTAWDNATKRHRTSNPGDIPRGVPVFWETPGEADHIALSLGNGRCLSNDIRRNGYIDEVPMDEITRNWNAPLLGWTEDVNGVTVYTTPEEQDDMQLSDDIYGDPDKTLTVGQLYKKLAAFIDREDKRAATLKAKVNDLTAAVDGLPEGATKAQIKSMLENLDATIQVVVNDPEAD